VREFKAGCGEGNSRTLRGQVVSVKFPGIPDFVVGLAVDCCAVGRWSNTGAYSGYIVLDFVEAVRHGIRATIRRELKPTD